MWQLCRSRSNTAKWDWGGDSLSTAEDVKQCQRDSAFAETTSRQSTGIPAFEFPNSSGAAVADVLDWLERYDFRESYSMDPVDTDELLSPEATSEVCNRPRGRSTCSSRSGTGGHFFGPEASPQVRAWGGCETSDAGTSPTLPSGPSLSSDISSSEPDIWDASPAEEAPRNEAQTPSRGPGGRDHQAYSHPNRNTRTPGRMFGDRGGKQLTSRGSHFGNDAGMTGKRHEGVRCGPKGRCFEREGAGGRDLVAEEEDEWDKRQRTSGSVGRLVTYHEGEHPRDDVVLRGGGQHHIVVAGVREGGPAARAGVKAGDRLASVNGRRHFEGLPADVVRGQIDAPAVLVFMGFVGKLQAEVRLTCGDTECGLLSSGQILAQGNTSRFVEERTYSRSAGMSSLFLSVGRDAGGESEAESIDCDARESSSPQDGEFHMFEMRRSEAAGMVRRAMMALNPMPVKAGGNTGFERFGGGGSQWAAPVAVATAAAAAAAHGGAAGISRPSGDVLEGQATQNPRSHSLPQVSQSLSHLTQKSVRVADGCNRPKPKHQDLRPPVDPPGKGGKTTYL
mmetsp:Transcript_71600/g.142078  ORF Transcript_71600/g.142078 Transcript_71600/m.142078 type:complete len:563 (+) Transcript_71600:109-1797(+)